MPLEELMELGSGDIVDCCAHGDLSPDRCLAGWCVSVAARQELFETWPSNTNKPRRFDGRPEVLEKTLDFPATYPPPAATYGRD
jgi:hypothetical protein